MATLWNLTDHPFKLGDIVVPPGLPTQIPGSLIPKLRKVPSESYVLGSPHELPPYSG